MTLLSEEIIDFITMPFLCCGINNSGICKSSIYDEEYSFEYNVQRVVYLLKKKKIDKLETVEFCCDTETDYSQFLEVVAKRL